MGRLFHLDKSGTIYKRFFRFGPVAAYLKSIAHSALVRNDGANYPWLPETTSYLISAACCRLRQSHDFDARRVSLRAINALRRLLVIGLFRFENIGYELLWVSVVERKPGTLPRHHDVVALLKNVIRRMQIDREWSHFAGLERLRLLEGIVVAATENLIRDH